MASKITVTFICNFIKSTTKAKPKKEKKVKGKDKKNKNAAVEMSPQEETESDELDVVVNVKSPTHFLHIEYNLLPIKIINKIDVVFWGKIAKVFTNSGNKLMKSINVNNHCWIAFTITHFYSMEIIDVPKLKAHVANVSISTNKNKISPLAKKEGDHTLYFKREEFYQKQNNLQYEFLEAFEHDPNIKGKETWSFRSTKSHSTSRSFRNKSIKYENSFIGPINVIPDEKLQKKILKLINDVSISEEKNIHCFNELEPALNVNEFLSAKKAKGGKGKDKKKNKKEKTKKGAKKEDSQFVISGESFFTDPNMSLYNMNISNAEIHSSFLLINVENLMKSKEKEALYPIIIKLDKIVNIPSQVLLNNGFLYVFFTYNICGEKYVSGGRIISNNEIVFNDHHVYFMIKENISNFVEQIQNGFFLIEIYGIKLDNKPNLNEIFGENKSHFSMSSVPRNKYDVLRLVEADQSDKQAILLAIVRLNLNQILNPYWQFIKMEKCYHSKNVQYLDKRYETVDKITMNSINIENSDYLKLNPLTVNMMETLDTCIEIEIILLQTISSFLTDLFNKENMLSRIILVIYDPSITRQILSNIYVHNSQWIDVNNFIPDYLRGHLIEIDPKSEKELITGFVICFGDFSLMFLEGLMIHIQKLIWEEVQVRKTYAIKVFFNSDNVYSNRIYKEFMKYGGIYIITFGSSLNLILYNVKTFISGFLPEPTRRVLYKLDLLRKCNFLFDIPDHLLPSVKELLSLDLEWGIPLYAFSKTNRIN